MADIEHRMGIETPILELLARRQKAVDQVAPLRARYGPGGFADAERKIVVSKIKALLRAKHAESGKKVTEAELDEAAHAHDDYVEWVTTVTLERTEWVKLEEKITALDLLANRQQAVARYLTAELGMTR